MADRDHLTITTNLPPGMYVKPDVNLLLKLFPELVAKALSPTAIGAPCVEKENKPCP